MTYNRQVWRLVEGGLDSSPQVDRMKFSKEEKERETMTIEGHCRGSDKIHNRRKKKERHKGCSIELLELAKDILCFEKHMQATKEEN